MPVEIPRGRIPDAGNSRNMFAESPSPMGKRVKIDPDLFGTVLQPVTGWQRAAIIQRLRNRGHAVTLRGRGRCTVYVTPNAEGVLIARRTGRERWLFKRFGRFTRSEIKQIHTLGT